MDYFFLTEEDRTKGSNPMIAMVDEQTGEKYARVVSSKGLGDNMPQAEKIWIVQEMSEELKAWRHPGGIGNQLILKSDSEWGHDNTSRHPSQISQRQDNN